MCLAGIEINNGLQGYLLARISQKIEFNLGRLKPSFFHFPAGLGSAPQYPAGHPGCRCRSRVHAAASSRRPRAGRGIRPHSGRRRSRSRGLAARGRGPSAEKTRQCPKYFLDRQPQADRGIMLQFRIGSLPSCHHRHPASRQQDLTMLQAGGHEGADLTI